MAVIKEIKNGSGGVIRIHDDYCNAILPLLVKMIR